MGRAYSIRPYSIGDFPAVYDHNLGASSHPINPGSFPDLGPSSHPWLASCSLSEAEGESSHDILDNHPTNNLKCPLIDHF
ncbi:hypothetical protein [Sphingobacterium mizutaii]|uniref:hypothetical protein n=1 Tax=Sphingobacterium mizutaii TaxID=1010 RepID=UPI0028989B9E|nr:hypothetical protein [Sphingobacterium mizutaii]